ncbi:MAG: transcription termination/antitermination protein NusG [Thermodesulfobacteriota bacterium]
MNNKDTDLKYWYVLHTKSRFENVVKDALLQKKIEAFLPTVIRMSRRKDRKKLIETPMFPGYIFVLSDRFAPSHLNILKTTGAVRLLGFNNEPVPVKTEAVESLILFSGSKEIISTGRGFKKGEQVIIKNGPLAGVKGIFEKSSAGKKVIVQIDILGQYAFTEVEEDNVEFLNNVDFIT